MTGRAIRSPWAPLVSGVLLYLFLVGYGVLAGAVVPWLIELWERSPRLGALGWLALLASPVGFVAIAHRAAHRVLDRVDRGAAPARWATSLREGLFAWFAISFSSMASALLLLAIFPPPPDEETLASVVRFAGTLRLEATAHTLLWIGVASLLYWIDRAAARD